MWRRKQNSHATRSCRAVTDRREWQLSTGGAGAKRGRLWPVVAPSKAIHDRPQTMAPDCQPPVGAAFARARGPLARATSSSRQRARRRRPSNTTRTLASSPPPPSSLFANRPAVHRLLPRCLFPPLPNFLRPTPCHTALVGGALRHRARRSCLCVFRVAPAPPLWPRWL